MSEWSPGIQKVLEHVGRTKGWNRLPGSYLIRRNTRGQCKCPIESLLGARGDWLNWALAGLDKREAYDVIGAADCSWPKRSKRGRLRSALLKAAGLTEATL